jgi:hypothetical protein
VLVAPGLVGPQASKQASETKAAQLKPTESAETIIAAALNSNQPNPRILIFIGRRRQPNDCCQIQKVIAAAPNVHDAMSTSTAKRCVARLMKLARAEQG